MRLRPPFRSLPDFQIVSRQPLCFQSIHVRALGQAESCKASACRRASPQSKRRCPHLYTIGGCCRGCWRMSDSQRPLFAAALSSSGRSRTKDRVVADPVLAGVLGASSQTILSLAPKSVTAGIAVGISEQIGGLQTLTIVLVIMTGITGAVLGPIIARLARIDDPRVVGLTMGIASHGIGTARALQINEVAGAFSGLGMGLNGVLTAILLPLIFGWFRF